MQLRDAVVLVSGGGSGLGAATVRRLSSAGARVGIVDLNAAAGEMLAAELGAEASFVQADVSDEASVKNAIQSLLARFGALHGLVHCAGVVHGEKLLGKEGPHSLAAFERVIRINLIGTFNMLRLAAEAMQVNPPNAEGERGVMVTTASIAAFDGQIGQAAYSASKAAVAGMTLPLARELARSGIRVVSIAPGLFETPMMSGLPPEVQVSLGASVPFPSRLGRPDEYALLAEQVFLNPMLNGEVIRLDGALRMAPK